MSNYILDNWLFWFNLAQTSHGDKLQLGLGQISKNVIKTREI